MATATSSGFSFRLLGPPAAAAARCCCWMAAGSEGEGAPARAARRCAMTNSCPPSSVLHAHAHACACTADVQLGTYVRTRAYTQCTQACLDPCIHRACGVAHLVQVCGRKRYRSAPHPQNRMTHSHAYGRMCVAASTARQAVAPAAAHLACWSKRLRSLRTDAAPLMAKEMVGSPEGVRKADGGKSSAVTPFPLLPAQGAGVGGGAGPACRGGSGGPC